VVEELRTLLGYGQEWLPDEELGFSGLGMDSLTSLELRNRLEKILGLKLPVTLLFDHPSPRRLAEFLAEQLQTPVSTTDGVEQARADALADVEDTDELAELLAQKLSSMDALL
jgi:acyl carrier protein